MPPDEEGGEESTLGEEEWPDVIGEAGDLPCKQTSVTRNGPTVLLMCNE